MDYTHPFVLARKKNGNPRPIKMGEFIRSSYAKRMTKRHIGSIRGQMRDTHQWGMGIPGACEALSHWRCTVESLALEGKLPALVAADVDLENMFGNTEWPAIRNAISDEMREIKAWTVDE